MTTLRSSMKIALVPPAVIGILMLGTAGVVTSAPAAGATNGPPASSVINVSLNDVSCVSASNCMAVGWFEAAGQGSFYFTLTEAWNGTGWKVLPSPTPNHPGGGAMLNSVRCTSPKSCTAVGETLVSTSGGFLTSQPLAEAWDGVKWTEVSTPSLTNSNGVLNGVSCSEASSCMAIGSQGPGQDPTLFTLAEAWNGTTWSVVATPPPLTPGGTSLSGISCEGASSCMAVGYFGYNNGTGTSLTLAEAWNGTRWKIINTPTPGSSGDLSGISCTGSTSCISVGEHSHSTGNLVRGTLAERWNGASWSAQATRDPASAGVAGLSAISCSAPTNCMATGSWNDQTGESEFTLAEMWNGTSWTRLRTPSPGSFADELRGVSCSSSSNCMAVGDFAGIGNELPLAEAWNGTQWKIVTIPIP